VEGVWIFPVLGVLVGILAGLLGIGGGLVLVAALAWILPLHGIPKEAAMHAALASSLASIVLTATSSAYSHHRRGSVLWPTVAWMVPGLLLGGWLGSGLAVYLDDDVLRCVPAPRGPVMSVAGSVIGAVSAVVGIGGGSMTVPLLVARGVQPVRAVGTSSACGVAIGIASAFGYALHAPPGALPSHAIGYIYLPAAIGVAIASVLAAPYGTRLAHRIGGKALKRVFAIFMVVMGIAIVASG
jgi:uncharacterized membrane protein YfcA